MHQMQPQMLLIQKTLLQIEGVGRQLYPDLDLWNTAQPLLQQWMAERWGLRATLGELRKELPDLVQSLRQVPHLLQRTIQKASDDALRLRVESRELEALRREVREDGRRRDRTLVLAATILGGLLWIALGRDPAWPGYTLLVGSTALLFLFRR